MAQVGGAYAALMGKEKGKGATDGKPKAAKVISLTDTKDRPAPKAQKKEEPKKEQPKKEKEPEKQLTKREVQDAVNAANQSPTDPAKKSADDAWKKERDEQRAREEAEREEEAKKITYADYEKQLAEKKADLGVKKLVARKGQEPKFEQIKKEDEDTFTVSKKKANDESKRVEKKGKTDEQAKKKKFVKSDTVQLNFKVSQPTRPERPPRGDRRQYRDAEGDRRPQRDAEETPAPATEEAAPAESS